jgi:hypothetical protein
LDNGTLFLPDDRILTGDFSITFQEGLEITYSSIKKPEKMKICGEPYLFYGYISSPHNNSNRDI